MTHPTTTPMTSPMTSPMTLDVGSLGELGRALDMTAEFLTLSSPRVRTELAAYLADFHPGTSRDQLIAYLGWRGLDLQRLARSITINETITGQVTR